MSNAFIFGQKTKSRSQPKRGKVSIQEGGPWSFGQKEGLLVLWTFFQAVGYQKKKKKTLLHSLYFLRLKPNLPITGHFLH